MKNLKEKFKSVNAGYIFILPAALLVLLLVVLPLLQTVYYSFFDYTIQTYASKGMRFIGLKNYFDMSNEHVNILRDKRFWTSLRWTLEFTGISVVIETLLGIILALILNKEFKGGLIVKVAILIPWAIPTIVSGYIWSAIFAVGGVANGFFMDLGLMTVPIQWLSEEATAKFAIIFADVWKTAPYMSLLTLAGLKGVPKSLYEAADVEGVSKPMQFFYITLPLIKKSLMVAILFRLIAAFKIYDLISGMTGGGPAGTTLSLSMYIKNVYFSSGNIGYGSALATVMMILAIILSSLFKDELKSKVGK